MKPDVSVITRGNFQWNGVDVLIRIGDQVAVPLVLVADGPLEPPPTVSAKSGEAFLRACLNAAWERGMRPDGYMDVRESMKATVAHLQDMRAIAFAKVDVEKPF